MPTLVVNEDLRGLFGPIRDQFQRPTCLAFAASDAHAALRGNWLPLSCDYLFFYAQRILGRSPHVGATIHGISQALTDEGQPSETDWLYSPQLPTDIATWMPPTTTAPFRRHSDQVSMDVLTEVRTAITDGNPPVIILNLTSAFDGPIEAIIPLIPGDSAQPGRCHAVIGVASGTVDGTPAILVRNSWGDSWGDGGYAWLYESYLQSLLIEIVLLRGEP